MTVECNAQSGPSRIRSRTFADTFTSRQGHQEIPHTQLPHTVHLDPHRHIDVEFNRHNGRVAPVKLGVDQAWGTALRGAKRALSVAKQRLGSAPGRRNG